MASDNVLRALAEETLERGTHPDRERTLREFLGTDDREESAAAGGGQGAGGESKPRTDADATEGSGGEQEDDDAKGAGKPGSPTTAPETGRQRGRSGR
jgi:hypothetical protein